ncbi:DotA/TraY family protein [Morganella psychrotolerans]|uniref:DotA/TraY family protein n=1 Tax=Morganella psychrotolerans TaxID=368603 RepID=UPI0039AF6C2A
MKKILMCWTAVIPLLLAWPAFANVNYQTIADAASKTNDLSRQALVAIFGDVVISPFQPSEVTVIGSLFAIINGVLCAIALFWFLTVTLKTVVKAGHEGQVFSSGTRSILYPIMTFAGFISLIPTASGWALSQLIMLWATSVMGIGSANLLTDKAADMMNEGYSLVIQPTAQESRSAASGIFEMNLCKYAINRELEAMYQFGAASTKPMTTLKGDGSYFTGNGSALCGSVHLPNTGGSDFWNLLFDADINTEGVVVAQRQALDQMQTTLDLVAMNFVDTYISKVKTDSGTFQDIETEIQQAAAAYETAVNQAINQINYKDTLQSRLSGQIKTYGWVALGSWYHTFATANSKTNDVAKVVPFTTGMSNTGEHGTGDLYNQIFVAYRAQRQNSRYVAPIGTQTGKQLDAIATAENPDAVFVGLFNSPIQRLTNYLATDFSGTGTDTGFSGQMNPLLKMQAVGDYTLGITETLLVAYGAVWGTASAASNSVVGWASQIFAVDAGAVIKDVLGAYAPLFYAILFVLLGIGFSLSVYLPAVPFLYWMVGIFNWIVSVLIGCGAGPMWAATHLGAEEDKGSRSAYGYVFLIDMMLRPSLMVLGFFFASVASVAGGTILNMLFASAIANANADSIMGIVKLAGWLMLYARIATFGVTRLFGLVAQLPDYIIAWLGGRDAANIMGGAVDNMKNMFVAAGSGMQRLPGMRSGQNPASKGNSGGNNDGIR